MDDLLMRRSAVISDCGRYRYRLSRHWDDASIPAVFIMLNPSTADADLDDPTIRRCMGFARRWRCGGIHVANLFAYRATSPKDMKKAADPIGPENWNYLEALLTSARDFAAPIICAWGANGSHRKQDTEFMRRAAEWGASLSALRITEKSLAPEHPLYVPYEALPVSLATPAEAIQ